MSYTHETRCRGNNLKGTCIQHMCWSWGTSREPRGNWEPPRGHRCWWQPSGGDRSTRKTMVLASTILERSFEPIGKELNFPPVSSSPWHPQPSNQLSGNPVPPTTQGDSILGLPQVPQQAALWPGTAHQLARTGPDPPGFIAYCDGKTPYTS